MNSRFQLYLASASPRRQQLLTQIGVTYQVLPNNVLEEVQPDEIPLDYSCRLALAKAQGGWAAAERQDMKPVLGADTIVVFDGIILEKPKDMNDGIAMLRMLSGQTHEVITAVALVQGDRIETACSISHVKFREISTEEAESYWQSGEPLDRAGGYAIQGKAAVFIKRIEGSCSGVMGLPLFETAALLEKF